mgnify:CR=1 FL=1
MRSKRSIQTVEAPAPVCAVAFSAAGDQVYSAGLDNNITAWELRKGAAGLTLQGHADTITGLRVSPEGNHLLSNSMDNTLRIWDMRPYAPANRCVLGGTAQGHFQFVCNAVELVQLLLLLSCIEGLLACCCLSGWAGLCGFFAG